MRRNFLLCILCALAAVVPARAQVERDPAWRALVAADKAIESGRLNVARTNGRQGVSGMTETYAYAPGGCFADTQTSRVMGPTTRSFDGQDYWIVSLRNVRLGVRMVTLGLQPPIIPGLKGQEDILGLVPEPCYLMGRGLSRLSPLSIAPEAGGNLRVVGMRSDGRRVVASVDPRAQFLARTIQVFEPNGQPRAFWQTSGALAGGAIAASSTYHYPDARGALSDSYVITSAKFGPLPASMWVPSLRAAPGSLYPNVPLLDYRAGQSQPVYYPMGVPLPLDKAALLQESRDRASQQTHLQARREWQGRLAADGLALGGFILVSALVAGVAALLARRRGAKVRRPAARSKLASGLLIGAALGAWALLLGTVGAYRGWFPGVANLRVKQAAVASSAQFGTIKTGDPRLQTALVATDLKGAKKLWMKPGAFVGTVSDVRETMGGAKLSLDFAADRATADRAILFPSALSRFPNLQNLIGRKVYVSGTIMPHEGRGEIVLRSPSQLLTVEGN